MGTVQRARQTWDGPQLRGMAMGRRSGIAVCKGEKTSMVVPGVLRNWLPKLEPGAHLRLTFNGRLRGWAVIKIEASCFHPVINTIPGCDAAHDPSAVGPEGTWDPILFKALCGGTEVVPPEEMAARAAKGWYVLDFTVVERQREWCAAMGIDDSGAA
jgi:hypothetical protein